MRPSPSTIALALAGAAFTASAAASTAPAPCLGVGGGIVPGRGIGPVQIGMLEDDAGRAVGGTAVWEYVTGQIGAAVHFANTPDPVVGFALQGYSDLHGIRHGLTFTFVHGGLVVVELTARLFHITQTSPFPFPLDAVVSCVTPSGIHLLSPWAKAVTRSPHARPAVFPDGRPLLVSDDDGIAYGRGTVSRAGRDEDVVFQIDVFRPHHFCDAMRFVASAIGPDSYACATGH